MIRFKLKVFLVLLTGVPLCQPSQVFAADDVNKAVESLAKLYKVDHLVNEYLFGSFAATDAPSDISPRYNNNDNKSGSSGFRIRGLKSLQYKVDENQIFGMKANGLSYVFTFKF